MNTTLLLAGADEIHELINDFNTLIIVDVGIHIKGSLNIIMT
ncbi:hypothetical protein [Streptococcus mitis]|nr:hypothetical protein [Streptococcus mitis]